MDRFENFNDGLVTSWRFGTQDAWAYKHGVRQDKQFVEFEIEVQDAENEKGSLITLRLADCESIVLHRNNQVSLDVLFYGLHVLESDGLIGIEFGDLGDEAPATMEDLRKSRFHVVAKSLVWQVSPFS
ncbi:hypothetical protein [Brevundimonas sp.]|uniref:hypothetical protein n=1 Tax=Brevundimonas sp. TaxID=1871086 RepID=UPI003F708C7A